MLQVFHEHEFLKFFITKEIQFYFIFEILFSANLICHKIELMNILFHIIDYLFFICVNVMK